MFYYHKLQIILTLLLLPTVVSASTVDPAPPVPDPILTPGDWNGLHGQSTPLGILCTHNWSAEERDVSATLKKQVFARYKIDKDGYIRHTFEVDHRIPLALDGRNTIENLWVESFNNLPYNAHLKDHLEDVLHRAVCRKRNPMPLETAQKAFIGDWRVAYEYYVTNKHWKD